MQYTHGYTNNDYISIMFERTDKFP